MVDWTLPLKMVPRPDVDGGSYGPTVHLRAMLADNRDFLPLSSMRVDRDTQRHFVQQFDQGVRYMVTAEREGAKPIYYKEDGTPWLSHHAALMNTTGPKVYLHERASKAMTELAKIEETKRQTREAMQAQRERARQAAINADTERNRERDAMESNALWGAF